MVDCLDRFLSSHRLDFLGRFLSIGRREWSFVLWKLALSTEAASSTQSAEVADKAQIGEAVGGVQSGEASQTQSADLSNKHY